MRQPHSNATREKLCSRLELARQARRNSNTPQKDLFQKTSSLWATLVKLGCSYAPQESTVYTFNEKMEREERMDVYDKVRRGHDRKPACDSRILLDYNKDGKAFIRYEKNINFLTLYSDKSSLAVSIIVGRAPQIICVIMTSGLVYTI